MRQPCNSHQMQTHSTQNLISHHQPTQQHIQPLLLSSIRPVSPTYSVKKN